MRLLEIFNSIFKRDSSILTSEHVKMYNSLGFLPFGICIFTYVEYRCTEKSNFKQKISTSHGVNHGLLYIHGRTFCIFRKKIVGRYFFLKFQQFSHFYYSECLLTSNNSCPIDKILFRFE